MIPYVGVGLNRIGRLRAVVVRVVGDLVFDLVNDVGHDAGCCERCS